MSKNSKLETLFKEMEKDSSLPLRESNLVFGEGDPDCQVLFIGEAPGFHENEQRRPFVGRAGQLLNKMLLEIGWKREDVYITNIVKRRPPENRDPLPEEIAAYKPYLARQIVILKPPLIATLGRFSMNYFLPMAKITRDHGNIFETEGRKIYPLFHPAAALRDPSILEALRVDFKKLPSLLQNKEVATPKSTETNSPSARAEKPSQHKLF